MSATPETTTLTERYPHLLGHTQRIEHLCPHCGEAILEQLVAERNLGTRIAEGWWRCPSCNHTCTDKAVSPQTTEAELTQCRKEDERRGQPGGGNKSSGKRGKPLPRKDRNHLQDIGGGSKDRSIVTPQGEKYTNTSVSLTNNELELARAYSNNLRVPISQIFRWGLGQLKHCGFCPTCQAPSPGETCLTCGLDLEREE